MGPAADSQGLSRPEKVRHSFGKWHVAASHVQNLSVVATRKASCRIDTMKWHKQGG